MKRIRIIAAFSRCATLEIENDFCFAPLVPFSICCNGMEMGAYTQNVFTLFDLRPNMCYDVSASCGGEKVSVTFITPNESFCVDVRQFGAVGDGKTDCTRMLQAAIAACPKGGTVLVPEGKYCTYPLFLRSHITIYLAKNAVLCAMIDRANYPVLPGMLRHDASGVERSFGSWEGNPLDSYASLITGIDVHSAVIAGEGVLDGNAQNGDWWEQPKKRRGAWRPRTVFLNGCNDIALVGITICNSPSWTVHSYYTDHLDVLNVNIENPMDSPNTDGIDPECCEDVRIIGTRISVGDDCIAVKSGKYYMAQNHFKRSKNLLVRNCLLECGHGAVVVGSEVSSGVDGLCVEQCLMKNTDRGLRIKTRRGRGHESILTNITLRNVRMENVKTPFVVNMFYNCDPDGHSDYVASRGMRLADEKPPCVGVITCENVMCSGAEIAGGFFFGLPEMPVESVSLRHVSITFASDAKVGMPAMIESVSPVCKCAIMAENVSKLLLEDVHFFGSEGEKLQCVHTNVTRKG